MEEFFKLKPQQEILTLGAKILTISSLTIVQLNSWKNAELTLEIIQELLEDSELNAKRQKESYQPQHKLLLKWIHLPNLRTFL